VKRLQQELKDSAAKIEERKAKEGKESTINKLKTELTDLRGSIKISFLITK